MRANADIESMTIGGDSIPVRYLPVNSYGGSVDGILGLDILGKYDLDIDGPNRTLGTLPRSLHHWTILVICGAGGRHTQGQLAANADRD